MTDTPTDAPEIRPLTPEEAAVHAEAVNQVMQILLAQPTAHHALSIIGFVYYTLLCMQLGPDTNNDKALLDQISNSIMTMRHNAKHQNKTMQ